MTDLDRIEPGQVWRYHTRSNEPDSRALVGRVEAMGDGLVVHVKLTGLRIANERAPGGFSDTMSHAPVAEEQFRASVIEVTPDEAELGGFEEGYAAWKEAGGGVFTVTLAEIADLMEQALR